jgi:hypothetical protein
MVLCACRAMGLVVYRSNNLQLTEGFLEASSAVDEAAKVSYCFV